MKYGTLSKLLILIPLSCAITFPANCADAHPFRSKVLLAASDSSGNITPEKIRGVVEMTLRQKWRPGSSGPEGGKAVVQFSIGSSGQLEGQPKLQQTCGQSDFDNICLDAIRKTSGLPPLPAYLGLSQLPFVATFHSGKTSWLELGLTDDVASGAGNGGSESGLTASAGGLGQSGWTQPSGSGSSTGNSGNDLPITGGPGQSDWIQPGGSGSGSSPGSSPGSSSSGSSGWTQPPQSGQSSWTQPASQPGQSGWSQTAGGGQPSGAGWTQSQPPAGGQPMWNQPAGAQQSTGMQALSGTMQSLGSASNGKPQGGANMKSPGPANAVAAKLPPAQAKKPGAKPATSTKSTPQTKPPTMPQGGVKAQTPMSNPGNVPDAGGSTAFSGAPGGMTDMTGAQDLSQRVILLNNRAVVAINDNNYEGAIKELEEALKIDPTYQQARTNLAIAYNNYGLQLKNKPEEAIKIFHKAYALDPSNDKTKVNLDTIIQYMGKNPKVFKDRLDLGNRAVSQGDMSGARIEFEAALAIKPDPIVQQKLQLVFSGAPPHVINAPPGGSAMPPQGMTQRNGGPSQQQPTHSTPNRPTEAHRQPVEATGDGSTGGAGSTGVSQKLDTMYRNLKTLEIKTFGKPFDSDDVLSRLARLEQKLLGKVQSGKPMRRLDALLLSQ